MKKLILLIIAAIAIIGGTVWGYNKFRGGQKEISNCSYDDNNQDIIYFYGDRCPHCHTVLDFLLQNKISCKVKFAMKETWSNQENYNQLMKKAEECELDPKSIGVPFLYAREKCIIGSPKVIEFFKKEAGME